MRRKTQPENWSPKRHNWPAPWCPPPLYGGHLQVFGWTKGVDNFLRHWKWSNKHTCREDGWQWCGRRGWLCATGYFSGFGVVKKRKRPVLLQPHNRWPLVARHIRGALDTRDSPPMHTRRRKLEINYGWEKSMKKNTEKSELKNVCSISSVEQILLSK